MCTHLQPDYEKGTLFTRSKLKNFDLVLDFWLKPCVFLNKFSLTLGSENEVLLPKQTKELLFVDIKQRS